MNSTNLFNNPTQTKGDEVIHAPHTALKYKRKKERKKEKKEFNYKRLFVTLPNSLSVSGIFQHF